MGTSDPIAARVRELADATNGHNPYVELVPLYSYGHSYTMFPSPYTTPSAGEYMERVRTRLGMTMGGFRGRSGTWAQETFACALSPSFAGATPVRTWTPASRGVVLIQNYMNEASGTNGGDPLLQANWLQAMRSLIALVSSAAKIPFASATSTGTWTQYVGPMKPAFSDQDGRFTLEAGNTVSFPVTGDEAWVVTASSLASYSSGKIEAAVGGTSLGVISPQGTMPAYTNTVTKKAEPLTPMAYKVTGMNAAAGTGGAKTLTLRVVEPKHTWVNCVILPAPNPPQVFVAKEPPRSMGATSGAPNFAAHDPAYRAMVDILAEEFPNVTAVDLAPGWDNSTMVGSLDTAHRFHPGDLGMVHIADRFVEAINATITAPDPGVMTL